MASVQRIGCITHYSPDGMEVFALLPAAGKSDSETCSMGDSSGLLHTEAQRFRA